MGDGPRFMQDLERLEQFMPESNPVGMLFIDSGGEHTFKKNSDLSVKRSRYGPLDPGLAAIALFTAQIYAYADSAKHKSSLRDNGPLVTLVDPLAGLWSIIWGNVPYGVPSDPEMPNLPWQRKTVTSGAGGRAVYPPAGAFASTRQHVAETVFSMPWRIRLTEIDGLIDGFVRKDFGTEYEGWMHPLTPYRRLTLTDPFKATKAPRGAFFYRNWLGSVLRESSGPRNLRRCAEVVDIWKSDRSRSKAELIVAGWAMDKAKAADFCFSRAPLISLPEDCEDRLEGMIEAARLLSVALRSALAMVNPEKKSGRGEFLNGNIEGFYLQTQAAFEARAAELTAGNPDQVAGGWLADLRSAALRIFNDLALPGLADRETKTQAEIVAAQRALSGALNGYGKLGREAFLALGLPTPEPKKGKAA